MLTDTRTFQTTDGDGNFSEWVTIGKCSSGRVVVGIGVTDEESKRNAAKSVEKYEKFIAQNPRDRLRELLAGAPRPEYLLAADVTEAIRSIAEILLEEPYAVCG
jgi:hypothetical protein